MDFILLIRDMPIKVTCKFEIIIFKGSQVIKYYEMFAFLFVQTVDKALLNIPNGTFCLLLTRKVPILELKAIANCNKKTTKSILEESLFFKF